MSLGMTLLITGITITAVVAGGAYGFLRLRSELSHATIVGKEGRVIQWHGSKGQVMINGKTWTAYSGEAQELVPGAKVLVSRIDDQSLKIQPVEEDAETVDLV